MGALVHSILKIKTGEVGIGVSLSQWDFYAPMIVRSYANPDEC